MEIREFNEIVGNVKIKNPILFGLGHDTIPSENDIIEYEKQNNVQLTEKYKQFLLKYGGGFFGFQNIYSLDKQSDFYIANHNSYPLGTILNIADNGCGDYYSLKIINGICQDAIVFYDHEIDKISDTEFSDIFEFLTNVGLQR